MEPTSKLGRRREPKTARGTNVVDRVVDAASILLQDKWIDQVAITTLAKEAGVARASLLLQFPNGWPDISNIILIRMLAKLEEQLFTQPVCETADSLDAILRSFVSNALDKGLLLANIRGHSFQAGEENAAVYRISLQDGVHQSIAGALSSGSPVSPDSDDAIFAAEMVLNFTLDIAAGMGSFNYSKDERLEAVSKAIKIAVNGLAKP